jgi:uncharacterized protein (DUF433 family)
MNSVISNQKENFDSEIPYDIPIYYSAQVARLVKISAFRVHRWLEGYEYSYESKRIKQPPVVKKKGNYFGRPNYASFYDLIDLLFVKRFLDYGLSLQKLRKAFNEAEQILNTTHFVHQNFFTDGKNICLRVKNKGDAILELLSKGQWVISKLIEQLAHQIDFDDITKTARRWFPVEGNRLIVLDPCVSFGRPTIVKKGITTENIYNLYIAEEKNEASVRKWMDLESKEIKATVKFEEHLAA